MKASVVHNARRGGRCLLVAFFLAWAAFYLFTALFAIANFAWRQPMFDQWRMYASFLSLPFPENVLHLENGHRPIIPNLIRSAEVHYFAANQWLQITIGTLCAILTAGMLALSLWRERALPRVARAAGVMLAVVGVFWMGNARMLLHGNEALQTYLVTLAVVCAAICTWQAAQRRHPLRWLGAACGACAVATFSFGSGIASFPCVIVLGALLRLPWRWQLLPLGALAACMLAYLFVLPGGQGVRGMLDLHLLESAQIIAEWLASPWANAWLGLADPPSATSLPTNLHNIAMGDLLTASANLLASVTGIPWQTLTAVLGFAGIAFLCVRLATIYLRRTQLTPIQALAIALCLFALATAVVIGIGRLDYLRANPGQVYADRYLMWSCLFWMGLAILLLVDASQANSRRAPLVAGLLFLIVLPVALLPTHRQGIRWGAFVFEIAQRTAAAARSGVFDPELVPNDAGAGRDSPRLDAISMMRQQHLAMFSDPAWERVGSRWSGSLQTSHEYAVSTHSVSVTTDSNTSAAALHFQGWITHGVAALRQRGQLAVLDDTGVISGLAEFSFIKTDAHSLRLDVPQKRGFDGYIAHYDSARNYTLVSLDFLRNEAISVASISAPPAAAPGR